MVKEEFGNVRQAAERLDAIRTPNEMKTRDGLNRAREDERGRIVVTSSSDDPNVNITPVLQLSKSDRAMCPPDTTHQITTSYLGDDGHTYSQQGVCYVTRQGLTVESIRNVRVRPRERP
jgi:hypothetical protein